MRPSPKPAEAQECNRHYASGQTHNTGYFTFSAKPL